MQKACQAQHPRHLLDGVPPMLADVIARKSTKSAIPLGSEKTAGVRKWVARARECAQEEAEFKAKLPEHCQRVLGGKGLLVFRDMLIASGHGDEGLMEELAQGFRLSGPIPDSHIFRCRRITAWMTLDQLASTAGIMREHVIKTVKSPGDDELDKATRGGTEQGLVVGPCRPEQAP